MERLHHLLILIAMALSGCNAPPTPLTIPTNNAVDTSSATPDEGNNPPQLIPARYGKSWFLPPIDRWDPYWLEQYKTDSTGDLRMRHADLDGDGTQDHAMFLCRTDTTRRDSAYAVVVSFGNGRDTLLESYSWAEEQGGIGMGLALEPSGPLNHLGGEDEESEPSTVQLKYPAVTVIFFEKASITWFWDKGSFQQVWTGD